MRAFESEAGRFNVLKDMDRLSNFLEKHSQRLIILPMMLLAVFLGLFAAVEYEKIASDNDIRLLINAPVSDQLLHVQDAIGVFESAVDSYSFAPGAPREKNETLTALYEDIQQARATLANLLLTEAMDGHEDLAQSDKFHALQKEIDQTKPFLPKTTAALSPEGQSALRQRTDEMIGGAGNLALFVKDNHRQEANLLLMEIAKYEKARALLSIFVLISGLILIVSLMNNLCHFRTNAERATAAERYNALFAAALQSTRVGVLIRDMRKESHPVVFVNAAFSRMTGYEQKDLEGRDSEFLFGWRTEPSAIMAFRRAISLQETATFDLLIYRKDGSPFWSEWHLSPVIGADSGLSHFVSLFTDTTALRQTQEDLIQAKEMAQHASAIKTNFLAMMSHEIRTPINGILGVLKLVEDTPLDEEQRHLIEIAETSSNALHGIINDILDYAKMEAGKIEIYSERFSLSELMNGIRGLFQTIVAQKNIEFQIDLQPGVPDGLVSDVGRIRQIILNLVSNALKFTDKGFVHVRILSLMSQDVDGLPGVLLRFEVQDTGLGISAEDQAKLFKEFSQVDRSFTRRFGGTGLGLAISRRLVSLLNGEIGIESQPGKGSKFWFMLPIQLAPEMPELAPENPPGEEASLAEEGHIYHVLLVEDNDTNRLVARRYLEKFGFIVQESVDGLDAIEKVKAAEFDLILMDVSMPKMDGMLATCHIRALGGKNATVPVIALTAHAMAGDKELCLAAGMNDYLFKPIDLDALSHTLERWLHIRIVSGSIRPAPAASPVARSVSHDDIRDFSTEPLIDLQILQRMKDNLGGEAVDQITSTFLKDSAQKVLLFKNETGDRERIRNTAHTLKSCSADCGLIQFSRLMEGIEKASARNDCARTEELLAAVSETYERAKAKLEAERGKYIA